MDSACFSAEIAAFDSFGRGIALACPEDDDAPGAGDGRARAGQAPTLVGLRVLVVEDESLVAMDLVATLEDMGAEVCGMAATSGDAVRRARALGPALAIVDIRLRDGETGVDAAEVMVRELGMAIVFATAHTDPHLSMRMAAVPGAARLTKPYDPANLLDAARRALAGRPRGGGGT